MAANDYLLGIFSSIYKSKNKFKEDSIFKLKIGMSLLFATLFAFIIFNEIAHIVAVQAGVVLTLVMWNLKNKLPTLAKKLLLLKLSDFELLIKSSPLAIYGLFTSLIVSIDLVMVGYLLGDLNAGIYSVASRLLYLAQLPATAIGIVMFSRYNFSNENLVTFSGKEQKVFNKILSFVALLSTMAVFFILIFGEFFIVLLFTENYKESHAILKLLCYSMTPLFLLGALVNILIHRLMYRELLLTSGFAALASLFLNFFLIQHIGLDGAALATISAYYLFFFGIVFSILKRLKNILLKRTHLAYFLSASINLILITYYG